MTFRSLQLLLVVSWSKKLINCQHGRWAKGAGLPSCTCRALKAVLLLLCCINRRQQEQQRFQYQGLAVQQCSEKHAGSNSSNKGGAKATATERIEHKIFQI
eukprot:1530-Heterococcus_DN1.PRE.3